MKVIFLDIDGVLNCQSSKSRCGGFIGIDNSKTKILRMIVEKSDAKIVLVSSWKSDWHRRDKELQNIHGNYLDNKLKRQRLKVLDKTKDHGGNRGEGIVEWIAKHPDVTAWVVLDDEIFKDYEERGIMPHLVKTDFDSDGGGLHEEHVSAALKILEVDDA